MIPQVIVQLYNISDNGIGIHQELLKPGPKGIKKLFLENETTKRIEGANTGYGCYIAYQMAVNRCGWKLEAENLADGGASFTININN